MCVIVLNGNPRLRGDTKQMIERKFVMIITALERKQFALMLFVCILVVLPGCTRHSGGVDKTTDLTQVTSSGEADGQADAANAQQEYAYCNDKYFYSMSNSDILRLRDFEGKIAERFPLKELLGVKGIAMSYVSYVNNEEIFVETSFWENDDCLWCIPLDDAGIPDGRQAEKFYEYPDTHEVSGVYADENYIIFFDESSYQEYDRREKKYLTVDGTDAKYLRTNASWMDYNIIDNLEMGNILLQKDKALFVHQLGSEKVIPLSLDGKLSSETVLGVCSTAGRIYYEKGGFDTVMQQDIWCYDTKKGTNEKILPWEKLRAAVLGERSDGQEDIELSDLYEQNGQIYMALDVAIDADADSLTQLWRYSPESGELTAEKGVNDYLRYLQEDIYTGDERFEYDMYDPYVKVIVCGKYIIDFAYKEYFYDMESGETSEIKKGMPEYYYSQWAIFPD